MTAPEVTGKPEGVNTGGGALLLFMGLKPPTGPLGPVAKGGLKECPLTSADGVDVVIVVFAP